MNIFASDVDPFLSAEYLDDARGRKMIIESAQILSTVLRNRGVKNSEIYFKTHESHPCTIWAGTTNMNFEWLVLHALELGRIYSSYSGREHASVQVVKKCSEYFYLLPRGNLTPFANCSTFIGTDITECYRACLSKKWETQVREPTWKNRTLPYWIDR